MFLDGGGHQSTKRKLHTEIPHKKLHNETGYLPAWQRYRPSQNLEFKEGKKTKYKTISHPTSIRAMSALHCSQGVGS